MKRARQSSESLVLAVFLALSGGLMDAYSYLGRGQVFANAQTGNMLLFGVNLAQGDLERCLRYALPVVSFAVGIALAHSVKLLARLEHLHWRQLALVIEALILVVVAFVPIGHNLLANSLTSLACGIQVQAFRKVHGHAFATTMCIGNLRSGTQELVTYAHTHERERLEAGLVYYLVIACFVLGAVIGSALLATLGLRTILVSPALLSVAFALMFVDRERRREQRRAAEGENRVE